MQQTKNLQNKADRTEGRNIKSTIIVRIFIIPLLTIDRTARQKIRKNIEKLSNTIIQLNLFDINETFYPITTEYTFFLRTHRTFTKTGHKLGNKTNLNKFIKTYIGIVI